MGFNIEDHEILGRKTAYKAPFFEVQELDMSLPNGNKATYYNVHHNGGAGVIPVMDDNKIVLIKQYRCAMEGTMYEIPSGKIEIGEDPMECAKREVQEETGYVADNITFLSKFYSLIGFCDEITYLYKATNIKKLEQNLDEDEFVDVHYFTIDEAMEMVKNGDIIDSKTIIAIQMIYNNM